MLHAGWDAAGAPGLVESIAGSCARCGRQGQISVAAAVSKNFTGYDGWVAPGRPGTCAACTWAHTYEPLRRTPHLISAGQLAELDLSGVRQILTNDNGLPADVALIYPLRPGRKHLLPIATWGRVTIDDMRLPWAGQDAARLQLVIKLRRQGFTGPALSEPAPPYTRLRKLDSDQWPSVLDAWEQLAVWRSRPGWLDLAVSTTRDLTPAP